jgi:hypothetical protein
MTPEEMKAWIDGATYMQLLSKWRFSPTGSPWFTGTVGEHFTKRMAEKRNELDHEDLVAASKSIGW